MNQLRVRVKMCGMRRSEDIACAVHLGVDALGFIFYPQSSRFIAVEDAKNLIKDLPAFVDSVAVLVNPDLDLVKTIINELPIQLLQFHGNESAEFCQQFGKPYIKTIHPESTEDIEQAIQEYSMACALLLDTPSTRLKGGTGHTFNWTIIPQEIKMPYILAGGINESNVGNAIELGNPFAVDLCSGIEVVPGIKDHGKMRRFMNKVLHRSD